MHRNQMEQNRKYITGQVREFAPDVEETRTVEFIISTPERDRHRTVLRPQGWNLESYNRNGIVGYQHQVHSDNPDNIIGRGEAFMEGDNLIGRVTFEPAEINPLAEKIFRKVLHGTLKATSVGFLPVGKGKYGEGKEARGMEQETYYFEGQELLEWSIVHVPSNRGSVGRSEESDTALQAQQDNPLKDPETTPLSILEKHLQLISQK
jgi:hypothetical protein